MTIGGTQPNKQNKTKQTLPFDFRGWSTIIYKKNPKKHIARINKQLWNQALNMDADLAELQRLWVKAQTEIRDDGGANYLCDKMFPLFSKLCTSSSTMAYRLTFGDGKTLVSVVCRTYSKLADPNLGVKGVHAIMGSQRYAILLSYLSTILEPEYYRVACGGSDIRVGTVLSDIRTYILRHDIFKIMLSFHNIFLEIVSGQAFQISEGAVAAEQIHLALFKCILGTCDSAFAAEVAGTRCFQSVVSSIAICYQNPFRGSSSLTRMAVDALEAVIENSGSTTLLASDVVLLSEEQTLMRCLADDSRLGTYVVEDSVLASQKISTQSHCIHAIHLLRDASRASGAVRYDVFVDAFLSLQHHMHLHKSLVEGMFDDYLRFASTSVTVAAPAPKKKEKGLGKVFGIRKTFAAMFVKDEPVHEETRFEPECLFKAVDFIRKSTSPEARLWFCARLCECLARVGTPNGPDCKTAALVLYDLCERAVACGPEFLRKVLGTIDFVTISDANVDLQDILNSLAKYLDEVEPPQQELIVRFFTTLASANNHQLFQRTGEYSIVVASCKVINDMSASIDSLSDQRIDVAEAIFCLWKILLGTDAFIVDFVKGMSLVNLVKCTLAKTSRPNTIQFIVASRNALVSLVQQRKESIGVLINPLRGLNQWESDTTAHLVNLALAIYGGQCHEEAISQDGVSVVLCLISLAEHSAHCEFNLHVVSFVLSMLMPLVRWSEVPQCLATSIPSSLVGSTVMIRFVLVVGCGLGVQSQILSLMLDACYSDLSDPSIGSVLCIEQSPPQSQLCELEPLVRLLADWYSAAPTHELYAALAWLAKAHRSPITDHVFCKMVIENCWEELMPFVGHFGALLDDSKVHDIPRIIRSWYSLTRPVQSRHALTFLGSGSGGAHGKMELPSPSWPPMNGLSVCGWFYCSHDGVGSDVSSLDNCVPLWRIRWHYGGDGEHSISLVYDTVGQALLLRKEARQTESIAIPFRRDNQWTHICVVLHRWPGEVSVFINGSPAPRQRFDYPVVIKDGGVLVTNRFEVTLGFPSSGGRRHVGIAQSLSMIGFQLYEGPLIGDHVNNLVAAPFHVRDSSVLVSSGATNISIGAPVLTDPHLRRLSNMDLNSMVRLAANNSASLRVRVPDVPALLSLHPTVTTRTTTDRSAGSHVSVGIRLPNMLAVPCSCLLHGRYSRPPIGSGSPAGVFLSHVGPHQWLEWLQSAEPIGRKSISELLILMSDCISEGIEISELAEREFYFALAAIVSKKIRFFTDERDVLISERVGILSHLCSLVVKTVGRHRVVVNGPLAEMLFLNWAFLSRLYDAASEEVLGVLLDALSTTNPFFRLNAWRLRKLGFVEGFVCGLVRYFVTPHILGVAGDVVTRFLQALDWDLSALSEVGTFLAATVPRSGDVSYHLTKLSSTLSVEFLFHVDNVRNVILDSALRVIGASKSSPMDISGAFSPSWFILLTAEHSHPVSVAISMSIFSALYTSSPTFRARCAKENIVKALHGTLGRFACQDDVLAVVSGLILNTARDIVVEPPVLSEVSRGQQIHVVFIPLLLHLVECCGLLLRPSSTVMPQLLASSYMKRFHSRGAQRCRRRRFFSVALAISSFVRGGLKEKPPGQDVLVTAAPARDPLSVCRCAELAAMALRFISRLVEESDSISQVIFAKDASLSSLEAVSWSVIASIGSSELSASAPSCDELLSDSSDDSDSKLQTTSRGERGNSAGISPKYPELLLASLDVFNSLLNSILPNFDTHTSNTFSIKTSEVVFWLHTILCSHPPGIGDTVKGWFQSKVIESWMFFSLATTKRLADANTSNRCKNCHMVGIYAVERLVAGFSVPPRALGTFLKGLRTFTSNSEIVKSIDVFLFDFLSFLATDQHHNASALRVSQTLQLLIENRDILARAVPLPNVEPARCLYKNLLHITTYVAGQRCDGDPHILTNDEIIITDLWSIILIENKSIVVPLLVDTNGRSGVDFMTRGFERTELCRNATEKMSFILWLVSNLSEITSFLTSGGGVNPDQRYVICSPKRIQGWSQRSEHEIHAERRQHRMKIDELVRASGVQWAANSHSSCSVDIGLLAVSKGSEHSLRPFVVRIPLSEESPIYLNAGGTPAMAPTQLAFAHLMQNGAVPLAALMTHSGDITSTFPQSSEQNGEATFKPGSQRVVEKILEGSHNEVRGAPVLWAGNVYNVVGNESLICLMFVTSYEVVIISSSQLMPDGGLLIASLETHEANKATHKKGAMVENVIRRFMPKAPIPSSLSSASLSTFRHSQYFRQLRTEAKAVQRDSKVWRFPLATLSCAHHRHFQHEPSAVEFVLEDGTRMFVVILDKDMVMSRDARKAFLDIIVSQGSHISVDTNTAKRSRAMVAQRRWIKRQLSTYSFLMTLNDAASRTFADMTQYPVMPWVLSCYNELFVDLDHDRYYRDLSWPLGALDETRRREVTARYSEWLDDTTPPFHYGTHYSTSAIVMYFLVRLQPFTHHAMAYQGGRLDVADRLFHSVEEAWVSCSSATGRDVKELIPEFYSLQQFLVNSSHIDLGTRRDGVTLGDVQLPSWSTSTAAFIHTNREALESDRVSSTLHQWIDLIFGYKQDGDAAIAACNVFHHLTYPSGFEEAMTSAASEEDRKAIVASVDNFGLTPKNIFKTAHPRRHVFHVFRSHNDYFVQLIPQLQLRHVTGQMCDVHCAGQPIRGIVEHEGSLLVSSFNRRTTSVKPLQQFVVDVTRSLILNYRTKDQCTTVLPDIAPFGLGPITCFEFIPSGNTVFVGTGSGAVVVMTRSSWTSRHAISNVIHTDSCAPISLLTYLGDGRVLIGGGSFVSLAHVSRRGFSVQWACRVNRQSMGDTSPVIAAALVGDSLDAVIVLKERSIYVIVNGDVMTAAHISASCSGMSTFTSVAHFTFSSASSSSTFCCGHSDGRVSFWSLSSTFRPKGSPEERDDYSISFISVRQIDVQGEKSAVTCLLSQPQSFSLIVGCRSGALWSAMVPQHLVESFYGDV